MASKILRKFHQVLFHASREPRASEIAAWSNALASLGLGGGAFALARSLPLAIVTCVAAFLLLRAALTHRITIWIAALFGTLSVAALSGALAWLFGHVVEVPSFPLIAGAIGASASAALPAWAYRRLAQRRADNVRDSLLDPIGVPSSR